MKAVCWHGRNDMRVDNVPDPTIEDDRDVIIRITASGICGSDLHLMTGAAPAMEAGDIIGHEPMGVVVETGKAITNLKKGDKVVVPFTICCGHCFFCDKQLYSACDNGNRNAELAIKQLGHSPCGAFGYTHLLGGYAGGQAEYLRVPFADVGADQGARGLGRRAGRLPLGHLPDRLYGRGELRHRAGRDRGRLGLRGRSRSSRSRAPGCSVPAG